MNPIVRKIMSLRKGNKIEANEKILPIRKINSIGKDNMEHKKIQEREIFEKISGAHKDKLYEQLQNKIMEQRSGIGLTKGVTHDIRKRQFIKKGILGLAAGVCIAAFSKIARAGGIIFNDASEQIVAAPSQSDQTALEASTDEDTYAPPDLIHFAPSAAKVWAMWWPANGHQLVTSYNYTSTTDGGQAGNTDHLFNVDFSSINYAIAASSERVSGLNVVVSFSATATTGFTSQVEETDGTNSTVRSRLVAFGDQ